MPEILIFSITMTNLKVLLVWLWNSYWGFAVKQGDMPQIVTITGKTGERKTRSRVILLYFLLNNLIVNVNEDL